MDHGPRTKRKSILAVSFFAMVAVVFTLFGVYGPEDGDSKYEKYTFQLDGGVHVIQVDREKSGDDNSIWFGVTSSWRQGVPDHWEPLDQALSPFVGWQQSTVKTENGHLSATTPTLTSMAKGTRWVASS